MSQEASQSSVRTGQQPHGAGRLDEPAWRIAAVASPQVKLVDTPRNTQQQRQWEGIAEAIRVGDPHIDWDAPLTVLGGPGTGKSSLLVDTAVEYLLSGGRVQGLVYIAASKESAARARTEIFERICSSDAYAGTGAPVRSVHSWAFAIYRAIRQLQDKPLPRLITGAEHDAQLRILLQGEQADGAQGWPEDIAPALGYVGFARQLRDVLLRATERGIGAEKLEELGRRFNRPMWQAAGGFLSRYEQVQRLSQSENLNASALMHAVLRSVEQEKEGQRFMEEQREHTRLLLVDDAHNLDPAAARFVEQFFAPSVRVVIAGDPDQCVFHFRGADESFLIKHASMQDRRIILSHSHRVGQAQAAAVTALQSHLPYHPARIPLRSSASAQMRVVKAESAMAEKLHAASVLRKAHLVDAVPWEHMAVIVRGVSQISALRRVLLAQGVPVHVDATSIVLAEQGLVSALLLAVEATYRKLTTVETLSLMESVIGGVDPVMVRRIERSLNQGLAWAHGHGEDVLERRDAAECIAALLAGDVTDNERATWTRFMNQQEMQAIEHVATIIQEGRSAYRDNAGVETVLWKVWQATQLSSRLQFRALRGGTSGAQADQDLDAMMSLFDLAGDFAERNPSASVETFVEEMRAQELPTSARDRRGEQTGAVEILPAHAAVGRQWAVTVVTGVQEDLWPAGPTVGGLFGQLELVDYLDRGITPDTMVSRIAPAVEEERRLFLVALSRATQCCVVTAVDNLGKEGAVPSRFLEEIAEASQGTSALPEDPGISRLLALEPLIAQLRDAVTNPKQPAYVRTDAAHNLAKLSQAHVYGAHPTHWWGYAQPSSTSRVLGQAGAIKLSPSRLEALANCSLAAFLDRYRGVHSSEQPLRIGSAIHYLAEAIVAGLSFEQAKEAIEVYIPLLAEGPSWQRNNTLARWREGIRKLYDFLQELMSRQDTQVTSEEEFSLNLGTLDDGTEVILNGRVDLLAQDSAGQAAVFDIKTSAQEVTEAQAAENLQLKAYQFMISRTSGIHGIPAALVYPGTNKASMSMRKQAPMDGEALEEFHGVLHQLASAAAGPTFQATPGKHCEHCDYKTLCPAISAGKRLV